MSLNIPFPNEDFIVCFNTLEPQSFSYSSCLQHNLEWKLFKEMFREFIENPQQAAEVDFTTPKKVKVK